VKKAEKGRRAPSAGKAEGAGRALAVVGPARVTEKEIDEYLFGAAPKIDAGQKALFKKLCVMHNLNPFKREVHISTHWNDEAKKTEMTVIVGYEKYIRRAESGGKLSGWSVRTEPCEGANGGKDLRAVIEIFRKDWSHPFIHSVRLSEYVQRKRDGKPTRFWADKAETMIKKVAVAQGFRLAFPLDTDGLPYTAEEIGEDLSKGVVAKQKPESKKGQETRKEEPAAPSNGAEASHDAPADAGKPQDIGKVHRQSARNLWSILHSKYAQPNEWMAKLVGSEGGTNLDEVAVDGLRRIVDALSKRLAELKPGAKT
jgi:phage recombination protein Bet